jgi:hypothetical protein
MRVVVSGGVVTFEARDLPAATTVGDRSWTGRPFFARLEPAEGAAVVNKHPSEQINKSSFLHGGWDRVTDDPKRKWKVKPPPRKAARSQRRFKRLIFKGKTTTGPGMCFSADFKKDVGPGVLRLVPEVELFSVQNTLRACDKLFANGGDGFNYFLNESRDVSQWALEEGLNLFKLPSMCASRQSMKGSARKR